MDRTSISRRIGSIKGDIEKLSNTLCAIEKTDIENYPDNYAMLTTDAALRSELIACRMRHLLYGSTATRKETYLASAGVVQGIRIKAQENMLEITLPCLLPKRKQRQSTEFLIDPLYFTLSQYSDNNELPKFRQCVVCFSHIYEGRTVQARVIAVAEKAVRIEAFGVECSIMARDLSWDWIGDANDRFSVGDQILVRILEVNRDSLEELSIRADVKSVSENTNRTYLKQCRVQSKYAGKVTDVHKGVVYVRLNNGANAIAHTCLDRRTPGKKDDVSFAVTHIDEDRGVAVGIITRIIKQHL